MKDTKVYLHKIATVVPEKYYTQKFALKKMKELTAKSLKDRIFLDKVYKGTQIEKRHAVIEDYDKNPEDYTFYPKNKSLKPEPTTEQRNDLYAEKAIELSLKVVRNLFDNSPEFNKDHITHIITVSCTGCMAPGFDFYIVRDLGLPISIHRYHLGFMGCQGAFPAMKLARNICISEPDARVLVVNVEICSVHLQQIRKLDIAIANAIFADGVSAALISSQIDDMKGQKYLLRDFMTSIADDTEDDMAWKIGQTGFLMKLSRHVPNIVKDNISPVMDELFKRSGITQDLIDVWAIHPGGKAILEEAEEILNITKDDLRSSYHVMHQYGNMSSVTIMFVLEHILQDSEQQGKVFAAAFGPGITIEAGLLEKITI